MTLLKILSLLACNALASSAPEFRAEVRFYSRPTIGRHKYLTLKYDKHTCVLSLGAYGGTLKTTALPPERCIDFYAKHSELLDAKAQPRSDFVTPHLLMAELVFQSGDQDWSRTLRVQTNRECDFKGNCQAPVLHALYPAFKSLAELGAEVSEPKREPQGVPKTPAQNRTKSKAGPPSLTPVSKN